MSIVMIKHDAPVNAALEIVETEVFSVFSVKGAKPAAAKPVAAAKPAAKPVEEDDDDDLFGSDDEDGK
jgi:hypothetical protein